MCTQVCQDPGRPSLPRPSRYYVSSVEHDELYAWSDLLEHAKINVEGQFGVIERVGALMRNDEPGNIG